MMNNLTALEHKSGYLTHSVEMPHMSKRIQTSRLAPAQTIPHKLKQKRKRYFSAQPISVHDVWERDNRKHASLEYNNYLQLEFFELNRGK